jgi:hypothetical protein
LRWFWRGRLTDELLNSRSKKLGFRFLVTASTVMDPEIMATTARPTTADLRLFDI